MGSLELRIGAQLDTISKLKDKQVPQALSVLRKTYASIIEAEEGCVLTAFNENDRVSMDMYLYCAEHAVMLDEWNVAEGCLVRLSGLPPGSFALQCRLLFVQCMQHRKEATGAVGDKLIDMIRTSAAKAQKGISIALQDKELSYLVAQGSKHCWNACRVLYRQGTVAHLYPIIKDINAALEAINYSNWPARVVWLIRQAVAEVAEGKDAKATVQAALSLCEKNSLDHLKSPLKRIQLALKMDNAKGAVGSVIKGIAACQTVYSKLVDEKDQAQELLSAYQDLASSTLVGASLGKKSTADKMKATEGDLRDREEILAEVGLLAALHPLPLMNEDPSSDTMPERCQRHRLFTAYSNAVQAAEEAGGAELTKDHFTGNTDVLQLAVDNMLPAIAKDTASKALRASSLKARVLAEYTAAVLVVQQAGGYTVQKDFYGNRCTPEIANQIATGVKNIVKALSSALRTNDIHIVQMGCILIWNMALPLLGTKTRNMVSKALQQALQALDSVSSNLHRLKVQLLYELALSDMSEEYLAKANAKVTQALKEDYVVDEDELKLYNLARPMDRFLLPLKERLDLKANIYYVPDTSTARDEVEREKITREEVILLLDRAQETKQVGSLLHTLQRAAELLAETEPPSDWLFDESRLVKSSSIVEPKASKNKKKSTEENMPVRTPAELQEDSRRRGVLRQRAALWAKIVAIATRINNHRMSELLSTTLPMLLNRKWSQQAERQCRTDQVEACLACANIEKLKLHSKNLTQGQRVFLDANGDALEPSEEMRHRTEVLKAQDVINQRFMEALELAPALLKDKDNWLVANIAISYMNWHADLFAGCDFIYHHTDMIAVQKLPSGQVPITVSSSLEVETVPKPTHGEASAVKTGMRVAAVEGVPVTSIEEYNAAVESATKQSIAITFKTPMSHTTIDVLNKIFSTITMPDMGFVPKCSLHEAPLLSWVAKTLIQCLAKHYITKKMPLNTPEERILSQPLPTFDQADQASPLLKEAEDVADKAIQALPTPMDAKPLYFLLASIKRLQNPVLKPADVPVKSMYDSAQEKVLACLEVLSHEGVDKEKVLEDGLADLERDPNVELCARLADKAMTAPAFPKCAVQTCQIAKKLEATNKLGVKGAVLSKHITDAIPEKKKATEKAAKKQSFVGAPAAEIPPPRPGKTEYTWYCNVLMQSGRAMVALIDPKSQEKATQTELRRKALEDFSFVVIYAQKGRPEEREKCLMQAVKLYHCAAQPFATAVVTRAVMQDSLTRLVTSGIPFINIQDLDAEDHAVLLELYLFLIQTCRERAEYDNGLDIMQRAFHLLPRSLHKPLWEADVQFRCKMGQSAMKVRDKMRAVKGYDPQTQARAWIMFSRCVADKGDQLYGLKQAVEALQSEPEARASALTSLAVWMYTRGRPPADCIDVLNYACDMITDTIDAAGHDDDTRSMAGTRSQGSLGASKIGASFEASSQVHTNASLTQQSSKFGGTTASSDGPSSGPTIQQLLTLGTIYTLLAVLIGEKHADYYVTLQLAVTNYAQTLSTTQRGLERRKFLWSASKKKAMQEKAALIPSFTPPCELVEYIGWEIPNEVREYLMTGKGDARIIGPHSIDDINYLLSMLAVLVRLLKRAGMALQLISILSFENVVLPMSSMHHVALRHSLACNLHERTMAHQALSLEPVAERIRKNEVFGELTEEVRRELLENLKEVLQNPPVPVVYERCEDVELVECNAPAVHKIWIRQSEALLADNQIGRAKTLVQEALVHAEAWKDDKDTAQCSAMLAAVALWEGRCTIAGDLITDALRSAPFIDTSMTVELLLMRTQLLLIADSTPEVVLSVTATAESRLTSTDPASNARFEAAKGDFLYRYVRQITNHYSSLIDPTLPEGYMAFIRAALQRAEGYAGGVGLPAINIKLQMIQLQETFLRHTLLEKTKPSLHLLKVMLNDQHQLLKACIRLCSMFSSETTPSPFEASTVHVVPPITLIMSRCQVFFARNLLRRCVVNCLLRRLVALHPTPAVVHMGDDPESLQVKSFLDSEIGLRFMSATKKQRQTRAKLRDMAMRRQERLKELEEQWSPPAPSEGGTPKNVSGKDSTAPTDGKAPLEDEVRRPTDADRSEWNATVREEIPSDEGSDTSSDDSVTETRDADHAALHVDGCEEDYCITPHDAAAHCSIALSSVCEGTHACAEASLASGEALRAIVETSLNNDKLKRLNRKGLENKPSTTAVDDMWEQAATTTATTTSAQVEEAEKPKPKKGAKKEDIEAPIVENKTPTKGMEIHVTCKQRLTNALSYFMGCDDWANAATAAHELARISMTMADVPEAAKYVLLAQSLDAAVYGLKVFISAANPQNKERVLFNRLAHLSTTTGAYKEIQSILQQTSDVYKTLRVWTEPFVPKGSTSTTTHVTLHIGSKRQHIYTVVQQPQGKPIIVSRSEYNVNKITDVKKAIRDLDKDRTTYLNGDTATEAHLAGLEESYKTVLENVNEAISPAFQICKELTGDIALHVNKELQTLPLERLDVFKNARMVTRDLSMWHYEARVERGSLDKPKIDSLSYIVDVHDESDGTMLSSMNGKGKGETGKHENGVLLSPSGTALVRSVHGASGVMAYLSPGRLSGDLPTAGLAGLSLSSLRYLAVFDNSLDPKSFRRISFQDSLLHESAFLLESPPVIATLLLCRGVTSLLTNQHACSIPAAVSSVKDFLSAIEKGVSPSEGLHSARFLPDAEVCIFL